MNRKWKIAPLENTCGNMGLGFCPNPHLGRLFKGSFCSGEVKLLPGLVRIMLETLNLVRKYTHICRFDKCPKTPLVPFFVIVSFFFFKKIKFFAIIVFILKALV